jgi:hypothetical protein
MTGSSSPTPTADAADFANVPDLIASTRQRLRLKAGGASRGNTATRSAMKSIPLRPSDVGAKSHLGDQPVLVRLQRRSELFACERGSPADPCCRRSLLQEQNDESQVTECRYFSIESTSYTKSCLWFWASLCWAEWQPGSVWPSETRKCPKHSRPSFLLSPVDYWEFWHPRHRRVAGN